MLPRRAVNSANSEIQKILLQAKQAGRLFSLSEAEFTE